jgi:hypothetical protein
MAAIYGIIFGLAKHIIIIHKKKEDSLYLTKYNIAAKFRLTSKHDMIEE